MPGFQRFVHGAWIAKQRCPINDVRKPSFAVLHVYHLLLQELLQTCGRSHSLAEVYAAIGAVKAAQFPSWSLDLISGLPKLTPDVWQQSLNEAVAAGPNHISIYDLQVRPCCSLAEQVGLQLLPFEEPAMTNTCRTCMHVSTGLPRFQPSLKTCWLFHVACLDLSCSMQ